MTFRNLALAAVFLGVMNAQAAGTTDTITATEVDTLGYDGVIFIAQLGTVTSTGVVTLTAKQSDTSATYGAGTIDKVTDPISGSIVTAQGTTGDSNKLLVLDINRPRKRYVRAQIDRATANVVIQGITAILYNARAAGTTQTGLAATTGLALTSDGPSSAT